MTDERHDDEEEIGLEAPERGSADELLDAGAHSELDAMRHSTAHVMAEAVLDLFPGTRLGIGGPRTSSFRIARSRACAASPNGPSSIACWSACLRSRC